MIEKSFVFIKPWSIEHAEEIFEFLDEQLENGFEKTKHIFIKNIPEKTIKEHYSHITHLPKFDKLVDDFINGSILAAVYTGENIIQKIRRIIGPTDPSQAPPKTIRGRFSKDSIEKSNKENRPLQNVIHSSDSQKSVEREIEIWKEFLKF